MLILSAVTLEVACEIKYPPVPLPGTTGESRIDKPVHHLLEWSSR
jgi:hypothetical protein